MRIALFRRDGGEPRIGVVEHESVVDVTDGLGPLGSCPLGTFLGHGAVSDLLDSGQRVPLAEVSWLPPALGAAAFVCVGLNYADHVAEAEEAGLAAGEYPALFTRYWSTVVGHLEPLVRPSVSEQLDFEGELAVVIGEACRAVPRERALEVVAGYTVAQEGSVRDWQLLGPTGMAGKNFERSGAMGPWVVTADEVPNPSALRLTTTVSGETMQDSNTARLIFDIPVLIEHITVFMPLAPGDVILTGTPEGVGAARKPPRWLVPGDVVTVEIEGVGRLENPVVDELGTVGTPSSR